jgi:hypothetical protein
MTQNLFCSKDASNSPRTQAQILSTNSRLEGEPYQRHVPSAFPASSTVKISELKNLKPKICNLQSYRDVLFKNKATNFRISPANRPNGEGS